MAMDRLSAHLDRAWDLVAKGDTVGARESARRAIEADPNSPEAYNLLGYIHATDGDSDEALENYRQAMALDEGYLEPMLNAAEILVHPLGEYDQAIQLCDDVIAMGDEKEKEEVADAVLLKVGEMLAQGEAPMVQKCLGLLPEGPFEGAATYFAIGRTYYEIGGFDLAKQNLEEAVSRDPDHADATYHLGLIADERGETDAATEWFLRTRDADLRTAEPAWAAPPDLFEKAATKAQDELLDAVLRERVRGARLYVADVPGIEVVADSCDPRSMVLLDGVAADPGARPRCARIIVYKANVERAVRTLDEMSAEIAHALGHEIEALDAQPEGEAQKPADKQD